MSAADLLERIQQVTAAARGPTPEDQAPDALSNWGTISISLLGALLTVCTALGTSERGALTRALLDQSSARAEFHAQDVKHRVAVVALQQVHATHPAGSAGRVEARRLAVTVERYLDESALARDWMKSYEGLVASHVRAGEGFDAARRCLELAIVIAAGAMMIRGWRTWLLALALGVVALMLIAHTHLATSAVAREAAQRTATAEQTYELARQRDRTTAAERVLVAAVRDRYCTASSSDL